MARFNALTSTLEAPAEPAKKAPRKKQPSPAPAKEEPAQKTATENAARVPQIAATPLATLVASVPVAAFAALLRTTDARTATAARTKFAAWCAARPDLPNDWRAAWTLHTARVSVPSVTAAAPVAPVAPSNVTPAAPVAAATPSRARAWLASL